MSELKPCLLCIRRHGNDGIPKIYSSTESDVGGYYRAHVRCEQCGHCVNGDRTDESAATAWNAFNS